MTGWLCGWLPTGLGWCSGLGWWLAAAQAVRCVGQFASDFAEAERGENFNFQNLFHATVRASAVPRHGEGGPLRATVR